MSLPPAVIWLALIVSIAARCRFGDRLLSRRRRYSLDNLVQLAAIEPYPAAPGTIIDLDVLPLRHNQIDLAHRAEKVLLGTAILVTHVDFSKGLISHAHGVRSSFLGRVGRSLRESRRITHLM